MTLEELNSLHCNLFESLCELKRICEKHNLTYFLAYGTLLGAIRHQGFIPWDDGIDTAMPRPDFNKFCKIVKSEISSGYSVWFPGSHPEKSHYATPIARINHKNTDLDIFALDYMKPNISSFKMKYLQYLDLARLNKKEKDILYEHFKNQPLKKAVIRSGNIIRLFMDEEQVEKKMYKILVSPAPAKDFVTLGFLPDNFPAEYFRETTSAQFEGEPFAVPAEYDKLLSSIYGDYMKYPPKEKRYYMIDEPERQEILSKEKD